MKCRMRERENETLDYTRICKCEEVKTEIRKELVEGV